MRIAFHATLKPPDHPTPSGDRMIARLLMKALGSLGDVRLASRLSTRGRSPEPAEFHRLRRAAHDEAQRLIKAYGEGDWSPDIWFTYHLYYKAPDWIGEAVSGALRIPYVAAEVSYAGKRDRDAWAPWQGEAVRQMRRADLALCMSPRDRDGLAQIIPDSHVLDLPPFLDLATFPTPPRRRPPRSGRPLQLVSVAMMRHDVKRESYLEIARVLPLIRGLPWHWHVVGDGPASEEIRAAFSSIEPTRITWHGRLDQEQVHAVLGNADAFLWPGIGEGFGMAYLEAKVHGLPVLAYATAGVPGAVRHGETGLLVAERDAGALAAAIETILADHDLRQRMGTSARRLIENEHSIDHAIEVIRQGLLPVLATRNGAR